MGTLVELTPAVRWLSSSQPGSRVGPLPRAPSLARSLLRRVRLRVGGYLLGSYSTSSLLLVIIYWYLWLTFCRDSFEFRRAIGSHRFIYLSLTSYDWLSCSAVLANLAFFNTWLLG
jgi:hypothetical protein